MSKPTDYPASVDKSVLEQQACTTSQALLCFTDYSPYLPIPCDQRMLPVLCLNAWSAVLAPLAHGLQTAPLAPGPARPPEGHMWIGKESGMLSGSCLNKSLSRPELTQRRHENLRACRNPKVVTALQNAMGCVYIYIYICLQYLDHLGSLQQAAHSPLLCFTRSTAVHHPCTQTAVEHRDLKDFAGGHLNTARRRASEGTAGSTAAWDSGSPSDSSRFLVSVSSPERT